MRKFSVLPVVLTLLVLVLVAGCGGGARSEPETQGTVDERQQSPTQDTHDTSSQGITIGGIVALTGNTAFYGINWQRGLTLALEEVNAAGGIPGLGKLEIIMEDDASDPQSAVNAANKLIDRDNVPMILGSTSSASTLAIVPVVTQAQVPLLNSLSSSPAITQQGSKYVFRTMIRSSTAARFLAQATMEYFQSDKIAIIYETGEYGRAAAEEYEKALKALGIEPLVILSYNPGDRSFTTQLLQIKAVEAEIVATFGYFTEVGLMLKQADELGVDFITIGTDPLSSPKIIELAGERSNKVYFTTLFSSNNPDPRVQDFVAKFQSRYNEIPEFTAAAGYDTIYLAADVLTRAGKAEPEAIREALAATQGWEGMLGKTTFDENGDDLKPPLLVRYRDGKEEVLPYRPDIIQP